MTTSFRPRRALLAAMLSASTLFTGCTGPQGPAGAPGESGAKGDPGAAGEKGAPGHDGQNGQNGAVPPPPLLDSRLGGWAGMNRDRLNDLIAKKGNRGSEYSPTARPVATFDWDNTIVKNDLGDATFFWMLAHDKVLQPANKDWGNTSKELSAAGKAALNAACDSLANAGDPLPTGQSAGAACADEIIAIYDGGQTKGGAAAWTKQITLTNNAAYTWVAQLTAGYTAYDVHGFAVAAFDQNAWAPQGAKQTIGTTQVTAWIRVYDQVRDLIRTMQDNGFDVWVVTASPQWVVEAVSMEVNVPADHVVGIRTVVDAAGKATSALAPCGADMTKSVTTFDQGKRCWINKAIFHVPEATQAQKQPDATKRQVFAAGDSDTDVAFVQDATELKLVINRNKTQLMCNAYANAGGKWLVNPMFIEPKSKKTSNYPCTTAKDADGNLIVDENGQPFSKDYEDTVFQLPN